MKRAPVTITALVLIALAAAGCSSPPAAGEVIRKEHSDAYFWTEQLCTMHNKDGFCIGYMPIVHTIPEIWELCLRDDRDAQHTGCVEVDQQVWSRYQTGQHYPDAR